MGIPDMNLEILHANWRELLVGENSALTFPSADAQTKSFLGSMLMLSQ